jgi:copper transport protein
LIAFRARHTGRILIGFFWALTLITLQTRTADAHAMLTSSDPAANAVVASAPAQIVMRFTEPLEPADSSATLQDANGQPISGAQSRIDPADSFGMILSVPTGIPNGTYVVRWQNVSAADGHPMSGFFAFTIGATSDETAYTATTQPTGGPPYWLITLVKWLTYIGLAVTVAAWPLWLLVIAPAVTDDLPGAARLRANTLATAVAGLVTVLVGSVLALLVQAWLARPQDGWASRTISTLTDTRYGTFWTYRMEAILLFTALSVITLTHRVRFLSWLAAAVGFVIPLSFSQIAHASAQSPGRTGAITADWLHLSAAMLWAGGLDFLVMLVWSTRSEPVGLLRTAVPRFSAMAIGAWAILALTGAYSAWLLAGSLDATTGTPWGHTLLVKLALLVPVTALAAIHLSLFSTRLHARLGPIMERRFRWSLALEVLLMIGVLLTVGRLVGQQPAGEAHAAAQPGGIEQALALADGHAATLAISPGAPGPNTYTVTVPDAPADPNVEALLRLTPPGATQAQKEIKLARQGDGTFTGSGAELALDGEWQIEVIVRQIGSFQWQQKTPVTIGPAPPPAAFRSGAWRFDGTGAIGMLAVAAAIIAAVGVVIAGPPRRTIFAGAGGIAGVAGMALIIVGTL